MEGGKWLIAGGFRLFCEKAREVDDDSNGCTLGRLDSSEMMDGCFYGDGNKLLDLTRVTGSLN